MKDKKKHKYEAYKKNDAREDEEELLPTSQRTYLGAGSFVSSVPAAVDLDDGTDGEDGGSPLLNSPSFRAVEATVASTGWATRTFMSGCAILLPIFVTVTVTGWLVEAVDGIFSPVFKDIFGLQIFGIGFLTALVLIFLAGLFGQSWIGSVFVRISELVFEKVPLVTQVYSAAKQIGQAIDPKTENTAFKECVLIRHPRHGEYAIAFVTGECRLEGEGDLVIVYVPTNHMYVGDIYLLGREDVLRTNLTVGEGLEVVVSMGMAMPRNLSRRKPIM
ncbi:integral membrane protein [Chloropicon roscoffensis]|uniref:Integral membrane protein n=1 Tax=Chloropicon roscoffensis TaxID=1461544 RepID=A0AAX4PJB7_9CHLO